MQYDIDTALPLVSKDSTVQISGKCQMELIDKVPILNSRFQMLAQEVTQRFHVTH